MSSGSDSDEDFVPGEPEQLSEEGSADEETDLQYEKELEHKVKKRKTVQESKGTKRRRTRNGGKESEPEREVKQVEPEEALDPAEEKKREEDLWAKFLEGTDKPKTTTKAASTHVEPAKAVVKDTPATNTVKQNKDESDAREKRIFEFAGETIVVENNVIKEKIKTVEAPSSGSLHITIFLYIQIILYRCYYQ